ncbi:MAG: DUF938 domain-containing protein [Arenibacterium sp.]
MPWRSPPSRASIASTASGSAKMNAPAAERNASVIVELVASVAPHSGRALELASGTGQHVVHLARQLPNLTWQPSEVDPTRLASINAYVEESNSGNIRPPVPLDATAPGWATQHSGFDVILLVNLLHLISESEAKTLISEAGSAASQTGILMLYGPFKRDGKLTSEGDQRFHDSLVSEDPEVGYKNDRDVLGWLQEAGFAKVEVVEMPANNLAFCAYRAD